jgi:hypothetical protein
MNYIPRGDVPTLTSAPRNVCDFCGRGTVVCVSTKGKGYWGAWLDGHSGKILGYFHSACMDAHRRRGDDIGGAA